MEEADSLLERGALNDLVTPMEANRDAEEESRGSVGKNDGGGSYGGSFAQSNSGSSGFSRNGRRGSRTYKAFVGISSPWSRDQGPLSNIE